LLAKELALEPTSFTPLSAALGGALIGLSAVILMLFQGRIAGISGIVGRVLPPYGGAEPLHAGAFIAGLLASPFLYEAATRAPVAQTVSDNVPLMIGSGLLVGLGTAVGSGCTSGHGVCGLSLFSPRSVVATLAFMAAGFVTVFLVRHAIGG
jgi:uncharacterized protein